MSGKITGIRSRIGIGTAVLIGLLLIAIPVAGAAHNAAYAAGNATQSKEESSHGNKGNGNGNQTSYGSSNEHRQYGNSTGNGSMGDEGKGHSKADEKRMEYASETAQKRHKEHISMHSSTVGPYAANMNYTLTADGTARSVSDNSTSISSSVSLDLSVWKSTKGLVSMDIMKGTINIGNETIPVHNGHAYYLIHNHQFRVLGFIVDKSNGNQGNETASTNLKVLKLVAGSDKTGKNVLPTASSDAPLKINILSPQSKLASEWFLKMDGEVKLG